MLKYKRVKSPTIPSGEETIFDILGGVSGKTRKIVSISTAPLLDMWLRLYNNSEQIVDCDSLALTVEMPFLPMDLSLIAGDVVKAGFYNDGAADTAKNITIGYTET